MTNIFMLYQRESERSLYINKIHYYYKKTVNYFKTLYIIFLQIFFCKYYFHYILSLIRNIISFPLPKFPNQRSSISAEMWGSSFQFPFPNFGP